MEFERFISSRDTLRSRDVHICPLCGKFAGKLDHSTNEHQERWVFLGLLHYAFSRAMHGQEMTSRGSGARRGVGKRTESIL